VGIAAAGFPLGLVCCIPHRARRFGRQIPPHRNCVLQDDGQIVETVCARQTERGVGAIIDNDQSGQAQIDLARRVVVQMRMKPRG
jgi:hypothetical protein